MQSPSEHPDHDAATETLTAACVLGAADRREAEAVRNSRIVIVDDESSNFMLLRKVLSDDGYSRVITTSDSTTAMETIRQASPDLVILDVMMPVVDGLEILGMMRRDPELREIPVAILTASDDPEVERRATELGVSDFLRKPVNPNELLTRVYYALAAELDLDAVDPPEQGAIDSAVSPAATGPAVVTAPKAGGPTLPDLAELRRISVPLTQTTEADVDTVAPAGRRPVTRTPKPVLGPTPIRGRHADGVRSYVNEDRIRSASIVIVDDEPFNFMVLRKFLADAGYSRILTTSDSTTAVTMIEDSQPDLVILDVVMPDVDGIEILTSLKQNPDLAHVPVLILTASSDARIKQNALEIGATDFLNKPVDAHDLLPRVRNSVMFKLQQDRLRDYAQYLEDQVRVRTSELIESRRDIVRCLARAGEYRDTQTGQHVLRVGLYAGVIADELGFSPAEVEDLELAAQLHDLGKIAIPDAILRKPGRLTEDEMQTMRGHCRIGMRIIQPQSRPGTTTSHSAGVQHPNRLTQMASLIASTHHERWDGSGYPCGLVGEQIPIEGRITAVADVFDALSSARPYKAAMEFDECFDMLSADRGKQFDPLVLDAILARRDDIIRIRLAHPD